MHHEAPVYIPNYTSTVCRVLLTSLVFIKFIKLNLIIKLNHKYDDPPPLVSSKFNGSDPSPICSDPPTPPILIDQSLRYEEHHMPGYASLLGGLVPSKTLS